MSFFKSEYFMKMICTFVLNTTALNMPHIKKLDIIGKLLADPIFLLVYNLSKEHNI
jgi:hypothetical protein